MATGLDWRALEVIGRVNGEERQRARATDMQFPIPFLVSFISGIMTLEPGDLIATGTPAGIGPLQRRRPSSKSRSPASACSPTLCATASRR